MASQSERIVVGFDGSAASGAALDWAAAEAERRHLSLTVLLAVEELTPETATHPARQGLPETAAHAFAADSIRRARRQAASIEITVETHVGAPIHALIQKSRHAELVVLGAHGRNQTAGAAAGPVALDVSARAHCPVMVIHSPEASISLATTVATSPPE